MTLPHKHAHITLNLIAEDAVGLLFNGHLSFTKQIWSYSSVAYKDDQA